MNPNDDATELAVTVGAEEVIAVFKPPLTPGEQRAIDEAANETARQSRHVSEVVRVLMVHAAQTGRRLSIEGLHR